MPSEPVPTPDHRHAKIILPGGAGLVGQNLVVRLKARGWRDIVVIDRHAANLRTMQSLHPELTCELADLGTAGTWTRHIEGADVVVMLQARIGGLRGEDFDHDTLDSTRHVLDAMRAQPRVPRLVHISSSVVKSVADDLYTRSKRAQEEMVRASGIPCPILRPTLMFGWFDRKHLGWLARFMKKAPLFPIPGHGRYMRQPLYVGDFCNVILRCIERPELQGSYDITGQEKVDYIDIIRAIKATTGARTPIVRIPYGLFYGLLAAWSLVDREPPFTTQQLQALVAHDEFEVIDWPGLFGAPATPFAQALQETFGHPVYARVALEF